MNRTLLFAMMLLGLTSCKQVSKPIELVVFHHAQSKLPVWHPQYKTTFVQPYDAGEPDEDELEGVQCPIPMECRVRNYTGSQCVFSSTEMLARWAECKKLLEPEPLTSRSGCRSYSGPSDLVSKLEKYGVKYEQSYRNREAGIRLIQCRQRRPIRRG